MNLFGVFSRSLSEALPFLEAAVLSTTGAPFFFGASAAFVAGLATDFEGAAFFAGSALTALAFDGASFFALVYLTAGFFTAGFFFVGIVAIPFLSFV